MYAQALAEDPNAFDYDGVYDSMQQQKAAPRHQERVDRRPKYIAALVEQAQVRKKEQDIAFERKLVSLDAAAFQDAIGHSSHMMSAGHKTTALLCKMSPRIVGR